METYLNNVFGTNVRPSGMQDGEENRGGRREETLRSDGRLELRKLKPLKNASEEKWQREV